MQEPGGGLVTERPAETSDPAGWRRLLRPLGALLGLDGRRLRPRIPGRPAGCADTVANLYDLLGNSSAAVAMRSGSGDRTIAKLLITVVAIAVGVGDLADVLRA